MSTRLTLPLLASLLALVVSNARAQPDYWEYMGGPAGGNVVTILYTTWGEIVVGIEGEGVSSSTDGGRTWSRHDRAQRAISSIAEHRATVFIGGRGALRRDSDSVWTRVYTFGTPVGAIYSLDTVLMMYAQKWMRSTDGGTTWSETPVDLSYPAATAGKHALLSILMGHLVRTTDGLTSTRIELPCALFRVAAADNDVMVLCPEAVMWSTDAGITWRRLPKGLDPQFGVKGLAISRSRRGTAAAIITDAENRAHVKVSVDSGATWFGASQAQFDVATLNTLEFGGGDTIFVGTNRGLFLSADLGRSYNLVGPAASSVEILSEPRASTMYALTTDDFLFRSDDAGRSWTNVAVALAYYYTPIVATGDRDVLVGTVFGLRASSDGGLTWRGAVGDDGYVTWDLTRRRDTIYRLGGFYLMSSTDEGATWSTLATRPGGENLRSIKFSPTGDIYVGATPNMVRYDAATGTLIPLSPTPRANAGAHPIGVGSDGLLFVNFMGDLFRSRDSGATWDQVMVNGDEGITGGYVFPSDETLVTTTTGVFRSVDRGDSWTRIGEAPDGRQLSGMLLGSDGRLYATTYGGGIYRSRASFSAVPYEREDVRSLRIEIGDGGVVISSAGGAIERAVVTLHSIDGTRIALLSGGTPGRDGALRLELPDVASGVYVLRVQAKGESASRVVGIVR